MIQPNSSCFDAMFPSPEDGTPANVASRGLDVHGGVLQSPPAGVDGEFSPAVRSDELRFELMLAQLMAPRQCRGQPAAPSLACTVPGLDSPARGLTVREIRRFTMR